jgi:hypothetical protein
MYEVGDYFQSAEVEWFDDERLRRWHELLTQPDSVGARLTVERARDGLTFEPAHVRLRFLSKELPPAEDDTEWSQALDDVLVRWGVRAQDVPSEALRFMLRLREAFDPTEGRFGSGFFNSNLVEQVKTGPFAVHPQVADVLKEIRARELSERGHSYQKCQEMIHDVIRGRAIELMNSLGYTRDEAQEILARALAQYLDERFSVTNRRTLGMQ